MSIRVDALEQSLPVPCGNRGSIFGEALHSRHVGGLWGQTLSLSPPTSDMLQSETSADTVAMDKDDECASAGEPISKLKALDSAVQTFSYTAAELSGCAYMFFECQRETVIVSSSAIHGPRLNRDPVLPRMVSVDTIVWKPMITNAGEEGHSYALAHEGEHVASIEVTASRVVVVHSTYNPAALEAGLVDPATRLVFERSHPKQLNELLDDVVMDDNIIYLPVSEVLLGKALDRIPLRVSSKDHPRSADARKIWMETRHFLRSMQSSVIRGIRNHNSLEFERAGVTETEINDVDLELLLYR
eukprot:4895610-Prymnesium_polylepis.1